MTTTQTKVRDSVSTLVASLTSVNFADLELTGFYSDRIPQTAQQVTNILKPDSTFIQNITIPKGKYNSTATYRKENLISSHSKYSVLHVDSVTNVATSASTSTPTSAHLDSTLDLASASLIRVAANGDLSATSSPNPVLTPNASLKASTYNSPTSLTLEQQGRVLSETSSTQSQDVSVLRWVDLSLSTTWANLGNSNATAQYKNQQNGLVEVKGNTFKNSEPTSLEASSTVSPSCTIQQNCTIPYVASNTFGNSGVMNPGAIAFLPGDLSASFSVEYRHVRKSKTSLSFGDSITVGYGVAPSLRWSKLVANALGAVEDDEGMSGTLLQDASNTPYGNAGYSRYQSAIINRDPDYLFILYGINDLRFNDASVTVFQRELTKIVQDSIAAGIKPGNITIGNPPYINSAAYTSSAPFNAGSLAKQQQYSIATHAVANQLRTKWADVFGAMQSHGRDSLVFDSLHPNAAGHQIIANALLAATFV